MHKWSYGAKVKYIANMSSAPGTVRECHDGSILLGDEGHIAGFNGTGIKVMFPNGAWDWFSAGELRPI